MAIVSVRYIVNNVDEAIAFYCRQLGFHEDMHPAPTFAMLSRGDLRLVLSAPGGGGGGGQAMPDGTKPEPGGWNRFSIEVPDLEALVEVFATVARTSAMTSSQVSEASRSSSTTRPEIPSNYSSRPCRKRRSTGHPEPPCKCVVIFAD